MLGGGTRPGTAVLGTTFSASRRLCGACIAACGGSPGRQRRGEHNMGADAASSAAHAAPWDGQLEPKVDGKLEHLSH